MKLVATWLAAGAAAARVGNWERCGWTGGEREARRRGKHAVRARGFVVAGTKRHVNAPADEGSAPSVSQAAVAEGLFGFPTTI